MKSNGNIHSSINAIMVLGLNMSIIKSTNNGKHMTFEKKKMIPHFMWNFSLKDCTFALHCHKRHEGIKKHLAYKFNFGCNH